MRKALVIGLAILLAGIGVYGLGIGLGTQIRLVFFTSNPAPVAMVAAPPDPANVQQQSTPPPLLTAIQSQVHDMAEDAKRTDRLVTLLLAVASLYAIALGLHSYFGLQQLTATTDREAQRVIQLAADDAKRLLANAERSSQDMIQRAKEQFDGFRDDIRDRYPEMANIHANLRELIGNIAIFQARDNWSDYTWEKLSERLRQETVMAESWFSVLEVFGLFRLNSYRGDVALLYYGFARFYSSRYTSTLASRSDWERSSIYFASAIEHSEPRAELFKDYAVHLTQIEAPLSLADPGEFDKLPPEVRLELERLREQAEAAFRRSLQIKPQELGAMFGLGWVLYRKQNFTSAIDWYTEVINVPNMSKLDRKQYLADSYRNRACCIWLNAKDSANAFADLLQSRTAAEQDGVLDDWRKALKDDHELKTLWSADPDRARETLA